PNAESDLAAYRTKYGLPACTKASGCLTIVNQNGAASPLPANAPANDDWTVEAALDLDLASAACPNCKLLLVLANDDQSDGLYTANNAAAAHAGVKAISNSWGGPEQSNSTSYETYFNHAGISEFVASGDAGNTGAQSDYPSTSAYVTAVGGTSLVKSSNARGWTEGAWSSGGSSCSLHIAKPSYQTSTACSKRMAADVASVGDPNTGLAVYNAGSGGWIVVGGTSAASPFVAGVYARYGITPSNDASFAYAHAGQFFDVTTGKNGNGGGALINAGAGWDGPTGLGTPNGATLNGGGGGGGGGGCTPKCTGKACGDDGCGGSCGTCGSGQTCSPGGVCTTGGNCSHPICSTGGKLTGSCDACAAEVCAADSFCCSNSWDSICVGEVQSVCKQSCTGGGGGGGGSGGGGSTCTHSICNQGTKLTGTCDSCATQICKEDSFCCNNKWDSQCVSEVSSICGESCN
ncbi:MAG TPA: S53 family peptidase, partial [Kofleriaceae bacterium]|nr:S53 family peptidase [Kofleriaceae bacterium]